MLQSTRERRGAGVKRKGESAPGRGVASRLPAPCLLALLALGLCSLSSCDGKNLRPPEVASNLPALPRETPFPITISPPPPAPRVLIETPTGEAAVRCGTCHRGRPSNRETRASSDLDEFHFGLVYTHGEQTCISCHEPGGYDRLRLADGTGIEFSEVMQLCRQCHGTTASDYDAGAHGGFTGHWDLQSGPRQRNHCVHCHDPHSPTFPLMKPTFRPKDRFLDESYLDEIQHDARHPEEGKGR